MFRSLLAVVSGIVALSVIFLSGCSQSSKVLSTNHSGSGIAFLKIAIVTNSPFQRIVKKATVTISASDMNTMNQNLTITDSIAEGKVIGIPAGKNRLFYVAAYDSLDTLQYSGLTLANIIADSTVNISITITRVSGNANINVNVNEGDTIPTNGLVAYYPFNGNANDGSGNGNNGIDSGATLTTDRFGDVSKAYSFNGQNDFISIPNSASLNIPGSFTVSLFFKYSGAGTPGKIYWTMINKNSTGGGNYDPFHIFVEAINNSADNMVPGQLGIRFADGIIGHERLFMSKTLVNDGNWHFVAFVYDSIDHSYNFSVDNILDSTMDVGSGWQATTNTAPVTLGNWPAYGAFFNGSLDDIRIYNRAFNATEISAIYHQGGWAGN